MDATQRIGDLGNQHMPGEEVWLVGERRANGDRKFYLSNLPVGTSLRVLTTTIKARWICEQAHQQLNEALGLDDLKGRSWAGLYRDTLMSMIAYAFLQAQRLAAAKGGKTHHSTAAWAQPSCRQARHAATSARLATPPMFALQPTLRRPSRLCSAKVVLDPRLQRRSDIPKPGRQLARELLPAAPVQQMPCARDNL